MLGEAVFTVVATVSSIVYAWPQAIQLLRSGALAGVSLAGLSIGSVSATAWAWYGFASHIPGLAWPSVAYLIPQFIGAVQAFRLGAPRRGLLLALAWAILLTLFALLSPALLAAALGGSIVALAVPTLLSIWRHPGDPVGVSTLTWWFGLFDGVLYLGYGPWRHDGPTITYGVAATLVCSSVLLLVRSKRQGARLSPAL